MTEGSVRRINLPLCLSPRSPFSLSLFITKALPSGPLLLAPPLHRDQRQDRLRHTDTSAALPLVKATFRGPAAAAQTAHRH